MGGDSSGRHYRLDWVDDLLSINWAEYRYVGAASNLRVSQWDGTEPTEDIYLSGRRLKPNLSDAEALILSISCLMIS